MFACLARLDQGLPSVKPASDPLIGLARDFSPRIEVLDSGLVLIDASGLGRLLGDAQEIGEALCRVAGERGLSVAVALAATRNAAILLGLASRLDQAASTGLVVALAGEEARTLAPLRLSLLGTMAHVGFAHAPAVRSAHAPHAPRSSSASRARGRGGARNYRMAPSPKLAPPSDARSPTPDPRSPIPDPLLPWLDTVRRWGLKTLGEFAALPAVDLFERLGAVGIAWQAVARGQDVRPLVPKVIEEPYEATCDLEWPIEALEPLSFILSRLFDPLCTRLERAECGAAVLQVTLRLVNRTVHVRTLELPAPMRDPKVLRTLALLDLESHPPEAGIDRVTVSIEPTEGRIVQYSLLARALPPPEDVTTLAARLTAVLGEGRVGRAVLVDSYQPGACELARFDVAVAEHGTPNADPTAFDHVPPTIVRRFRECVRIDIETDGGRPARFAVARSVHGVGGLRRGRIVQAAGPWRSSGDWWRAATLISGTVPDERREQGTTIHQLQPWDRDEWDIVVEGGGVYRIHQDRASRLWFIEGVCD
jgi:protein ImuB